MTLATTTRVRATATKTRPGRAATVVSATARGVVVVARAGREPEDEVRRIKVIRDVIGPK